MTSPEPASKSRLALPQRVSRWARMSPESASGSRWASGLQQAPRWPSWSRSALPLQRAGRRPRRRLRRGARRGARARRAAPAGASAAKGEQLCCDPFDPACAHASRHLRGRASYNAEAPSVRGGRQCDDATAGVAHRQAVRAACRRLSSQGPDMAQAGALAHRASPRGLLRGSQLRDSAGLAPASPISAPERTLAHRGSAGEAAEGAPTNQQERPVDWRPGISGSQPRV